MRRLIAAFCLVSAVLVPELPILAQPSQQPALGPGPSVKPTVLPVTTAACHLQAGQVIQFIGPIGPNGDYILVVHAPNNSAAAHWVAGVYTAAKFLPNQDLYLLEAKAKAPTLHQDDTIHSAVMNITTKDRDNTPLTIDFVCPPHSLGGGAHGGTAHLNN